MAFGNYKQKQQQEEEEQEHRMEEDEDESEEEEEQFWDDWEGEDEEGEQRDSEFVCLFCESRYSSCGSLFDHCASLHRFDFHTIRTTLSLDFYASFKLINFIRSRVNVVIAFFYAFVNWQSCKIGLGSREMLGMHYLTHSFKPISAY